MIRGFHDAALTYVIAAAHWTAFGTMTNDSLYRHVSQIIH